MGIHLGRLPEEIGQMNMYQFTSYLNELGKKVNWDMQLAGLPAGIKPNDKWHPFTPSEDRQKEIRQKTQGSLSDFINVINHR